MIACWNPFSNPWALKLRLVPPACLTDQKYGVHKYLKVNDVKLHYVESGDPSKPLMLFIHGFPEFWYTWRHQIVEFNKDYWCVAVDNRGYGDSEKPENVAAYHIDVLVEDVRDLIRQLGRDKAIVVSHDWGGLIACRFRDVHPDAVIALIMLSSTSREAWTYQIWNTWRQTLMSWYVFFFQIPVLPEFFFTMQDLSMFDNLFKSNGKNLNTQDIECYKYWFGKPYGMTLPINYYRANLSVYFEKKYIEDKVPMLVANASNDVAISPGILEIMKTEYAQIETIMIEDCGHFSLHEEPEKVNKIITDFLNKHSIK
ncbi:hypothetical protein K1T71_005202 [Dendrolimus kikuchii]|uniref:Uncharacterized protein n=1 Tax=Dendrolimus kikuchii TaxID=765133 RepID=A0ACC1D6L0_9NEOP|nr:hypothetical protein K1T71_005202 [Dendrolimus kikuchii]